MMRRITRALLIDADDTLWENNIYYLRCTARFAELMGCYGIPAEEVIATLDRTERGTIMTLGYGPTSYRTSLGKTCVTLLRSRGLHADEGLIAEAQACADMLFDPPVEILPAVPETLRRLRASSLLVMVTKGEEQVQRAKIERSGLAPLFDRVLILPEKDADTYRRLVCELRLEPPRTWMVGNSPRSDINPAIEAGLNAIYIPHDHTWTAERQQITRPEAVVVLERFADLPTYFDIEGDESPS
ncbi:MAG: HAD family hydrolase [Chloroflexi bacterium]|nr:HAD family hydrolase [Chloroflexota bacterium]